MPDVQPALIEVPPTPAARRVSQSGPSEGSKGRGPEAPKRVTSKGIAAGDIVLVDKKGRRFHALVTELEQLESGRFELAVRPLDSPHLVAHRVRARGGRGVAQDVVAPCFKTSRREQRSVG